MPGRAMIDPPAPDGAPPAAFELSPDPAAPAAQARSADPLTPFSEGFRVRSAFWFCRLRFFVAGALALFALAVLNFPGFFVRLGFAPRGFWALPAACTLVAGNLVFLALTRRAAARAQGATRVLWGQILFDLLALTFVVHRVGSVETGVAHAYLFHIVLACIFFPRGRSLVVTLVAIGLHAACVAAEWGGILADGGIFLDPAAREALLARPAVAAFHLGFTWLVWIVVWDLAATLSRLVQNRNEELFAAKCRLEAAQRERTSHMLRTAHELKSPFAAIHANAQLLLKGMCGPLPESAREVLERISTRALRLAEGITQMLQLANLETKSDAPPEGADLDLAECLRASIGQHAAIAEARGILLAAELSPAPMRGVPDQIKMMFDNLVANAINYSRRGGRVTIACAADPSGGAAVTVADEGIGIAPEKLPRIFEEHYRTEEAVRHNRESTGLGLAIVRKVAESHGVAIRVESSPGAGTRFALRFPAAAGGAEG